MRPIAISLSPNTEKDDVLLAVKTLLSPWNWYKSSSVSELETKFASYFGESYKALAVNSGRSAEYLILKTLGVSEGDLVAMQALTCVAVANPIIWNGASPLYIDVDETYNMDPADLEKKINKNVKSIIVQNSFGVPSSISDIKVIAQKFNIPLIEDCAISLGAQHQGKKVGTLGDVSFFSFGRDKVISSVFGGMILTSNLDLFEKLKKERDKLVNPSPIWVLKQLTHPILFSMALPVYFLGYGKLCLGKFIIYLFQKLGIIDKAVYAEEKIGGIPKEFPSKMTGALSVLALNQFSKLDKFNEKRRQHYFMYSKLLNKSKFMLPHDKKGAIWLRIPIYNSSAKEIINYFKGKKILIGDWYKSVVTPVFGLEYVKYKKGSCPNAEKYASNLFNLPTYPLMKESDVKKVVTVLNLWEGTR